MNKIAVFACFSKDNRVEDYIIYYLTELRKIADIIIVYDNTMEEKYIKLLRNYTIHGIFINHNLYDFGSYKIGINWLIENNLLNEYDSLILCNDSVFGPFYPLEKYFKYMESKKDIDFWGFFKYTHNRRLAKILDVSSIEHVQSYFIVFNKRVLCDSNFYYFIENITLKNNNIEIIKEYEIGLSQYLTKLGYKSDGIFVGKKDFLYSNNRTLRRIKKGFPFLKKKFFTMTQKNRLFYHNKYKKIKKTIFPYNMNLIDNIINNL